jgi:hypothetical protein
LLAESAIHKIPLFIAKKKVTISYVVRIADADF